MKKYRFLFIALDLKGEQTNQILTSAYEQAEKKDAAICCVSDCTGQEHTYQNFVIRNFCRYDSSQFDGAAVFSAHLNVKISMDELGNVLRENLPGVPLLGFFAAPQDVPVIKGDARPAIYSQVEHLVRHHNLDNVAFFIYRPNGNKLAEWEERYRFFLDAAAQLGVPGENITLITRKTKDDYDQVIGEFIKNTGDKPYGIVCQDVIHAKFVCEYLQKSGQKVGIKYKVTGYDGIPELTELLPIPLSTCRVPHKEMGAKAVDMLITAAKGDMPIPDLIMPAELAPGESCGCFSSEPRKVPTSGSDTSGKTTGVPDDKHATSFATLLANAIWEQAERYGRGLDSYALLKQMIAENPLPNEPGLMEAAAYTAGKVGQRFVLSKYLNAERDMGFMDLYIGGMQHARDEKGLLNKFRGALHFLKTRACRVILFSGDIKINLDIQNASKTPAVIAYDYKDGDEFILRRDSAVADWRDACLSFAEKEGSIACLPLLASSLLLGFILVAPHVPFLKYYNRLAIYFATAYFKVRLIALQHKTIAELNDATRKLQEYGDKMESLSRTDEMTGLLNRRGFVEHTGELLQFCVRHRKEYSLFFIDLDYLKKINDHFGHAEGDFALKQLAGILEHTFRESDVLSRFGGDEFVVFAVHSEEPPGDDIRTRFFARLAEVNENWGRGYTLSASLGITTNVPDSGITLEQMLKSADQLMYAEKKHRKPFEVTDTKG